MGQKEKIKAFKELCSFIKTHPTTISVYSEAWGRGYTTQRDWASSIKCYIHKQKHPFFYTRKDYLNDALLDLTMAESSLTIEKMALESQAISLLLRAGATPNHSCNGYSVFQRFNDVGKIHGMIEIAKSPDFIRPDGLDKIYEGLPSLGSYCHGVPYLEPEYQEYKKELVCTLFQKGMYPTNPKVFEKLAPVVLEKDCDFFYKKKEQVLSQMKRAKTPLQIYNAIMGRRKEKN